MTLTTPPRLPLGLGLQQPVFIALDVDSADWALELARKLSGLAGGFKLGPRLIIPHGGELVRAVAAYGPVFVDCKFLDIPSTMVSALQATHAAGASFATVHSWAGAVALSAVAEAEAQINKNSFFCTLAVTVLTSFTQASLPAELQGIPIAEQVLALAKMASSSGLRAVVCSPQELPILQGPLPHLCKVTPGIRLPTVARDDQARTCTPREALEAGAEAIVIGRPVLAAANPVAALEEILRQITQPPTL